MPGLLPSHQHPRAVLVRVCGSAQKQPFLSVPRSPISFTFFPFSFSFCFSFPFFFFCDLLIDGTTNITVNAKDCFERLERSKTKLEAFRLSPPSMAEILAIEMGTPMSVTVSFPGNVTRIVKVDSFTTVADVVARIAGKVQAISADQYGLFILPGQRVSSTDGIPVSNRSSILDVLTHAESIVKEFKSSISKVEVQQAPSRDSKDGGRDEKEGKDSKSKSKSKTKAGLAGFGLTADSDGSQGSSGSTAYTLICRKRIWTKDDQILESDFVSNILYSQVTEDYLNGNLLSMTELNADFAEVAAQIAALQMKCGLGQGSDHFVISALVPQIIYQIKDGTWWHGKVMGIFSGLKEQPEIIFKRQILKILQELPLFGSTLFTIKVLFSLFSPSFSSFFGFSLFFFFSVLTRSKAAKRSCSLLQHGRDPRAGQAHQAARPVMRLQRADRVPL